MAGHSAWTAARSLSRDPSVAAKRLAPGTWRRVLGYAQPYRRLIVVFLGLVVLDAVFVVVTPLLFRQIIDDGVTPGNRRVVVTVSLLVAGLAVLDAAVGLVNRWLSSRIGEGLI